jgi:drug/metabolite transporter (DMT)-like permease
VIRLQGDLALLTTALIWGFAFVVQRQVAGHMGILFFNGTRFILAALILTLFLRWWTFAAENRVRTRLDPPAMGQRISLLSVGLALFVASNLQQLGLRYTTAGNAGFITALYVVFIPILLWFVWRRRTPWPTWIAALVAVLGVNLLSQGAESTTRQDIQQSASVDFLVFQGSQQLGDGIELLGSVMWALHMILVERALQSDRSGRNPAVDRMYPDPRKDVDHSLQVRPGWSVLNLAIGQYWIAGVLSLALGLIWEGHAWQETWDGLRQSWQGVLYVAVLSTSGGYTLQIFGQKTSPPTDAALILNLEAVFAAVFGCLVLQEQLSNAQVLGCTLILAASLVVALRAEIKRE